MFDIFFVAGDPVLVDDDGWLGLPGQIVLGDLRESFIAPLGWWSRPEYEHQWLDGARRLMRGESPSAFVIEPGRIWWTAWLDHSRVIFQQRLIVSDVDTIVKSWTKQPRIVPYELIGRRERTNSDGDAISEWDVALNDLRDFDLRRSQAHVHNPPANTR